MVRDSRMIRDFCPSIRIARLLTAVHRLHDNQIEWSRTNTFYTI